MALASIIGRQYGHANVSVSHVESSASGTEIFLGIGPANYRAVGTTAESIKFWCPVIATCPAGSVIQFIEWNAEGTVVFERVAGSTDTVNGGASVTYSEDDYSTAVLFVVLSFRSAWRVVAISGSGSGGLSALAPNISIDDQEIDAGHSAGDGKLYLALTAGEANPTSLGANAVALIDGAGLTLGAGSVSAGPVSADVGAASVGIGTVAGAVSAGSVAIGEIASTVAAGSVAIGDVDAAVAAGSVAVGEIVGAVSAAATVVGKAASTVAAGAAVCGQASNAVPAGSILLGNGAAAATAGIVNLPGITAPIVDVIAASTHSVVMNFAGVEYKVLLST